MSPELDALQKLRGGTPAGPFRAEHGRVFEPKFSTPIAVCGDSVAGSAELWAQLIARLLNDELQRHPFPRGKRAFRVMPVLAA